MLCFGLAIRRSVGDDVTTTKGWIRRFRDTIGTKVQVTVRIDAGGDCAELLAAFHEGGARFIAKAKLERALSEAIRTTSKRAWKTVDRDAMNRPTRQVADINFTRKSWKDLGHSFRVIAIRSLEHDTGKQVHLWPESDFTVQAYFTNDPLADANDIAFEYNGRAEVEPAIAELKYGWGIGKIPSDIFCANHALFLLKLLAHNLMRAFVRWGCARPHHLACALDSARTHQHPGTSDPIRPSLVAARPAALARPARMSPA